MIVEKKISFVDYIVAFLLIGVSSIPMLVGDEILVASFLIIGAVFVHRRLHLENKYFFYLVGFCLLFLFVFFIYDIFKIVLVLGFILRVTFGYMAIRILGVKFYSIYIQVIYFFAFVSVVFYSLIIIFPSFEAFLFNNVAVFFKSIQISPSGRDHIGIYTLEEASARVYSGLKRNAGPFWEPGGFGIFLNLSLFFVIITKYKISVRKIVVIILALLTTFSTGSYFSFSIIVLLYISIKYAGRMSKNVFYFLVVLILYISYLSLPFLQQKIEQDILYAEYGVRTRTGSIRLEIDKFMENPLIGTGIYKETRFSEIELQSEDLMHRTSGLFSLLSQFGIIGFFIYFYNMKISLSSLLKFNQINVNRIFIGLVIIMSLGLSQSIFLKPFFFGISLGLPLMRRSKPSKYVPQKILNS